MKPELRFSLRAEDDLLSLSEYTADRFGAAQERKYREGLFAALQKLLAFPHIGTDQSDVSEGLRRFVYERHALYYSERPDGILIERILGPGQDPAREFEP